ncbi:replication initiation protein [Xanthocytophaga flava]|uniref:replication initiation protein n=1 Tax=Xanthocytophaga flava TaxID=3048013 RepID=UPI0028CFF79E|nr:replication initiation protein [Xanthocytophaga flavus]MDJ1470253.1 replication initiation protein [Xanthocytophaga flavus]
MPVSGMKLAKGQRKTFNSRVAVFQPSLFGDEAESSPEQVLVSEKAPKESVAIQELNALITAQYDMPEMGKKLFVRMLEKLPMKAKSVIEPIYLDARDLLRVGNLTESDAIAELEKTIANLIRQVCWIASADGPLLVSLISSGSYNITKGLVRIHIDPVLYPYYQQLKTHFDISQLEKLIQFKSFYSKCIYDLFTRDHTKDRKFYYPLAELKRKLLIEENEYERYNDLRRYVLSRVQNDLAHTPVAFTFQEKRDLKNRVLGVEFQLTSLYRVPI